MKRKSLGRELYPVCENFLRGVCPFPKLRCWGRHPRMTHRRGNIVIQYDKVYSSRVQRYLNNTRYSHLITQHSEVVGYRYGVSKKSKVLSRFLFVSSSTSILQTLQEDTVLSRIIRRCYVVSKHFLDLDSIKRFVRVHNSLSNRYSLTLEPIHRYSTKKK